MKCLSIALLGLGLTVLPTNTSLSQENQNDSGLKQTHKDINIMRRVIVKSIDRELAGFVDQDEVQDSNTDASLKPDDSIATSFFYTYKQSKFAFSQGLRFTGDSRGFYVPGHGAMFSLGVNVPQVEVEPEEQDEIVKEDDENDLWVQVEREDRGIVTLSSYTALLLPFDQQDAKEYVIDEESVEIVVSAVVKIVGKHGLKIAGLGTDESIVVALSVRGNSMLPQDASTTLSAIYTVTDRSVIRDDTRHIVIEIAISDLQRYANQRIDMDALEERAKITKY